ncbi:MAG: hypothetical protein ABFD89_22255 [Bryobacteraceae bacterium]
MHRLVTLATFLNTHARLVALVLILLASTRIIATYSVFSYVTDEPAHIACGMEWLDRGTYYYEDQHPPLARIAAAFLPWLLGAHSQGLSDTSSEGIAVLDSGRGRDVNLFLARFGVLPFFWIACASVYFWSEHFADRLTALFSLTLFSTLPVVLGHAGLAATDMALTGFLGATLLLTFLWFERPTAVRTILLAVAGACTVLSKLSSMPFFAAALAAVVIWLLIVKPSRLRYLTVRHLLLLLLGLVVCCLFVWAGYRFSFGLVNGTGPLRPAPEFFSGIKTARWHNRTGHLAYLLGRFSQHGFTSYYPIALAVKTPLPFLLFSFIGIGVCFRHWRDLRTAIPLACSIGMLSIAIVCCHINIGIRHVLSLYVPLSIVAGIGARALGSVPRASSLAAVLLGWLIVSGVIAHPDYIAYFNEAASFHPERILIDSDLDWGQDNKRLGRRLRELKASSVALLPAAREPGLPEVTAFSLTHPSPGWNAAHLTALKLLEHQTTTTTGQRVFWVDTEPPTERVGRGILLWYCKHPCRSE